MNKQFNIQKNILKNILKIKIYIISLLNKNKTILRINE